MPIQKLFDIGANVGNYTICNKDKYDEFILVEANPSLIEKIESNVKRYFSDMNCITVLNGLVTSTKENAEFFVSSVDDRMSTCQHRWMNDSRFTGNQRWVKSDTDNTPKYSIDELVEEYGIPTHIKIDVEGYELNVLHSMTKKYCPISFEWSEELLDELIQCIEYLVNLGFIAFDVLAMTDNFKYQPIYKYTSDSLLLYLRSTCVPSRKTHWGMIFAK